MEPRNTVKPRTPAAISPPTSTRFDTGPNQSQRLIDEEILASERHTLHLKTQRNTFAAVSTLPDDVLGEIFTTLAHSAPLPWWYQINLVCRRWRDTALGTVALWTRPWTRHHDLAVLMLERAKAADVDLEFDEKTQLATATAMLTRAGRIRALTFVDPPYTLQDVKALERFRSPDSELRSLGVHFSENLRRQPFDWNLLPLPSLAHLTLDGALLLNRITIEHLLLTLRDMPRLESVELHSNIISQQTLPPTSNRPSVQLPCLRSINIKWQQISTQHVIDLFSRLHLPQLCKLYMIIVIGQEWGANVEYSPFLRTVSSLISQGNFGTLDNLVGEDEWFLLISTDQRRKPGTVSRVEIELIDYDALENPAQNFTHEVFAALDDHVVSRLTQLRLHAPFWISVEAITPLFRRLRNLQSIEVSSSFIWVLTMGLSIPPGHSADSHIGVFPKLQEIIIYGIVDNSPMVRDFCSALKTRQRQGIPIGKLHFHHYDRCDDSILSLCTDIGIEIK